jgi:hypothetical protein|tara:strand:- start:4108 stop:6591 length:2484 start_codon:yes stop_codon:yes gene_type:complete
MAIERIIPATPIEGELEASVQVEIEGSNGMGTETEDGGMLIDLDPNAFEPNSDFFNNLAEEMDESSLHKLSSELIGQYQGDRDSRGDWEETYIKGLDQLGLKLEDRTLPWPGACGVFHPMLTEAVVRFQSQAITEIFPAAGPVNTKILGRITPEKEQQAGRVQDYMNYLLTDRMTEYRTETEKLLFSLPLAGSAFRKVYYDPNMDRPCAIFVPAEDFIVSYGATDLQMADRATHVMKKNANDVRKLQVSGFYRDVDLPDASPDPDDIRKKYDELTGDRSAYDFDNRYTLLEMMVNLDLEGLEDTDEMGEPTGVALPYVVTIDLSSSTILAIRRNWYEGDETRMMRQHYAHYQYLPGLGFYGFGLVHLIGGLAKSATSLLRQLVDAGTLSNLPGGLKARGLRIKGDDTPIMPGEFRDVDIPGGAIRDNISFLPYKEPSTVLYQLLGNIVEEGRRFTSASDMNVTDMKQEAPVGTTLAILERAMKVMSAIQARLHASMRQEFNILVNVIKDFTSPSYPYEVDPDVEIKMEDFDDRVDVMPVSDPNSATMAQRIMQYQAALQLAQQAPQMYNLPELHRQMLDTLGIHDADKIIPLENDIKPADPVSENMSMINGEPVKAFEYQDQESHIKVHMAAIQDPELAQLGQNNPQGMELLRAAVEAHIREHLAFLYRDEIEQELGTELPPLGEPLPESIEKRLSSLVADAAEKLLQKHQMEIEQQRIQKQMQDPLVQAKIRELDIKEAEVQRKAQADTIDAQIDMQKSQARDAIELERIRSQEKIAESGMEQKLISDVLEAKVKGDEISSEEAIKAAEIASRLATDITSGNNDGE